MNPQENKKFESELDSLIANFEKKQKSSFAKGFIMAIVMVVIIIIMLFLAMKVIDDIAIKNSTIAKKERVIESKNAEIVQNKEAIIEVDAIFESVKKLEDKLPKATKDQLAITQEKIDHIILGRKNMTKGDSLYVWALNGMNLRNKPNTAGKILGEGQELGGVVVLKEAYSDEYKYTAMLELSDSIKIPIDGSYLKVEVTRDIGTHTGYMFDGYLSRLPVYPEATGLESYFEKLPKSIKAKFKTNYTESGIKKELSFSSLNFNESFLIARTIYDFDSLLQKLPLGFELGFSENSKFLLPGKSITINKEGNKVKLIEEKIQ